MWLCDDEIDTTSLDSDISVDLGEGMKPPVSVHVGLALRKTEN